MIVSERAPARPVRRPARRTWPIGLVAVVVVGAAVALRFWRLAAYGWQYDEIVYYQVATSLLHHGGLTERIPYGTPYAPFLYQPPWYPYLLSGWFKFTADSITSARYLGVICSAFTLAFTYRLVRRLRGPACALYALAPVAFDGWLLYVERTSYIENLTLALVTAGMLGYARALDRPSWYRFAAAGAVLALAACLKYTGLYSIVAIALCWLILRRQNARHLVLVGTFAAIVALDQAVLIHWWGHWYLSQTAAQLARVIGLYSSGGTLTSPTALIHLLAAQYKVYAASFAIAVAGFVLAARRLLICYRQRQWDSLQPQALLFSWAAAAVVVFGFSNLRFPQYFALVLLPLYLLWWTEVWQWDRAMALKVGLAAAAVGAGLVSFAMSESSQAANPMAAVEAYAAAHIPRGAVVVADEQVGDLLHQAYCREQQAAPCMYHASYAITWNTYLQSTQKLGDGAFHQMFAGARRVWSASGFSGTVTLWKLHLPTPPVLGVDVATDQNYPASVTRVYGQRVLGYIRNDLHAGSAGILWDLCSPGRRSEQVARCAESLTPGNVAILIHEARADHLAVQLRPIIRIGPPAGWINSSLSWEGYLNPPNQKEFFANLLKAELPYLRLVRGVPHAQFVVATEPFEIAASPYWRTLLVRAHAVCKCQVNVASQFQEYSGGTVPSYPNQGVDWYPALKLPVAASQAGVTAAVESSLDFIPQSMLMRTAMDEESIRATAGAYAHPSYWGIGGNPDPQVQARFFTAMCQTVVHYHMPGVWFFDIPLNDDPANPFTFPAYFVGNSGSKAIASCAALFATQN
jgi:4-amino-4-deoxy-L-arabinose transferase-like glycosyltransferase